MALYGLTLGQAYMPHLNYWMNKDFIASVLCENKDKPEMKCDGKCHLKKEIRKAENEKEEGQTVSVRMMVEFFQPIKQFSLRELFLQTEKHCSIYGENPISGHLTSIFHPPRVWFSF
ncbi:MAG: hypothetical protein GC178_14515 [Flavobacteriales bacterium]|nr:hypothetical protein [Flavobacteriales bacterium]